MAEFSTSGKHHQKFFPPFHDTWPRYHAGALGGTIMEVSYEGEAHHPDLVLPVVTNQPPPRPPPAEPLSRSLPLPPRLARSHVIEEEEEDYELLLGLLDAMDPSSSWDTELTEILDSMSLNHNPRFARSNDKSKSRKPRYKRKRQLKRTDLDLDTSASTRTHPHSRSSRKPWTGASSFSNTKMTPFIHESVRPIGHHSRHMKGYPERAWARPERVTKYARDEAIFRQHYY